MKHGSVRKFFRRLAFLIGALAAVLTVFILEENIRGRILLSRYKAELRAKGEKLTLAELDLLKPPKEGNGAAALLAAADELAAISRTNRLPWYAWGSLMRFTAPGRAEVLHQQEELLDWEQLDRDLVAMGNALDKARGAARQPVLEVGLNYTESLEPQLLYLKNISKLKDWLTASALEALHRGNLDKASENIVTIVDLMRLQKNGRSLRLQMPRLMTGTGALRLTWEALQADGWTDQQLATLQERWQKAECLPDFVPSLEMNRVGCPQDYSSDRLKDHLQKYSIDTSEDVHLDWADVCAYVLSHLGFKSYWREDLGLRVERQVDVLLTSVHWLIWRAAWFHQDQLRALRRWSNGLDGARTIAQQKSWKAWSVKTEGRWTLYDNWRYMLWYASQNCIGPMKKATEYETLREMTITAIALKRYQLHTRTVPTNLSALVPEFLPELPRDWMDGEPLRYRLSADGSYVLYSVGDDGRDDGGNPRPAEPRAPFLSIWDGRDAVWPQPSTPAEAAALVK